MQPSSLIFALVAFGASLSLAAPTPDNDLTQAAQSCPDKYNVCGTCNGSSCKIVATNHSCDVGSCVGDGGGDGAICGYNADGISCPGSG